MLSRFEAFGVSFIIEDAQDLGQYGLDDPGCTITIATEEETHMIRLGDCSQMDEERYVPIGDGNVYLVQNDPLDDFDAALSEMIDKDETPSVERADRIAFSGAAEYEIVYEENSDATYCADDVYFTQQDGETLSLDTSRVENYLQAIDNLDLSNYMTYKATEEDLQTYGLHDPELTVQLDYTEEDDDGNQTQNSFVLHISRDPEQREKVQEGDTDEDEQIIAYARVGESPSLYKITQEEYYALIALRANSFTDEQPDQKEEISLTVHLDNENHPSVSIALYRYDGNNCLAMVDGKPVSLVGRSYVVDLIEAVNAIVLN